MKESQALNRESDLHWLSAMEEIKQVKAEYCYAADVKDWPRFAATFTLDGQWDIREFPVGRDPITRQPLRTTNFEVSFMEGLASSVSWPVCGRQAIEATARAIAGPVATVHKVFAPLIEMHSETTATAIWGVEDVLHFPEGSPIRWLQGMGHYHDTYERGSEGRWLIKSVDLKRLWVNAG